jgi:2-amino-4-hydroxy-6-hydroxymethyldihydropteridine diphosphokinase
MEYGLSLGANLGDRLANLSEAKRRIAGLPRTAVVAASPVYETEPVDVAPRFRDVSFLNAAIAIASDLGLDPLHAALHAIEQSMGRVRSADRNAPRPVDIDIIYADGVVLDTEALALPHPRWASRRFVVQPLADIRPDLVISAGGPTVRAVLLSLSEKPDVVLFSREW